MDHVSGSKIFNRTDRSVLNIWWWTVDRWTMVAIFTLLLIGGFMSLSISGATGGRIGLDTFYLARHHLIMIPAAVIILLFFSLMTLRQLFWLSCIVLIGMIFLAALTPLIGTEIKGARRWIRLAGFSLQPSEFIKPAFALVAAWLLSRQPSPLKSWKGFLSSWGGSFLLYGLIIFLLIRQPDLGMAFVVSLTWFSQLFFAGLHRFWILIVLVGGVVGLLAAYTFLPHVAARVDRFLNPESGDNFQVNQSLAAFAHGGLYGKGPGEGTVKRSIPDAHSDFVFAVIGEELGLIVCVFVVGIYCFIFLRGMSRLLRESSLFILLATSGILLSFTLQAMINIASAINLIPTKGMTLPFISYGGSSMLAVSMAMGMFLSLTRQRPGQIEGLP